MNSLLSCVVSSLRSLTICFRYSATSYIWLVFMPLLPVLEDLAVVWQDPSEGNGIARKGRVGGRPLHDLPTINQPRLQRFHVSVLNSLVFYFSEFPAVPRPHLTHWRASLAMEQGYVDWLIFNSRDRSEPWVSTRTKHIKNLPPHSTDLFELYIYSKRPRTRCQDRIEQI